MKKSLIVTLVAILVIIAGIGFVIYKNQSKNSENINGKVYITGYIRIEEEDQKIILSNYSDFNNYFEKRQKYYEPYGNRSEKIEEIVTKYNERYFNNKSLAVVYNSFHPSDKVTYKNATINNDTVLIEYEIDYSNSPTEVISGYFIVVEIPKGVNKIL